MKKVGLCMGVVLGLVLVTGPVQADMSRQELRMKALEEKVDSLTSKDSKENYGPHGVKSTKSVNVSYGKKGFHMETGNGLFSTNLQWRAQLRYSGINRSDPRSPGNFGGPDVSNFEGRRLRMKIGGHGYKPWIKYYFEVDLQPSRSVTGGGTGSRSFTGGVRGASDGFQGATASRTRVIDWRIDVQPIDEIGFRVGQWKINYNRERVDSSGRQQFVERSIVNRIFNIDRQVGAMLQGRLFKGTHADLRYYAGVFNGEGKAVNNPDGNMMYMGRLQWNFLGRDLKWRQSDVKFHKKPAGSLAFAAAANDGVCTRWSSSGCGGLSGFTSPNSAIAADNRAQFKIEQYVQEFAFKYKGLSIQEEYHWKEVRDNTTRNIDLEGAYAQIGYFPHGILSAVPEGLELAFRYAFVDEPDSSNIANAAWENHREEFTGAINYFIAGHSNKVTLDYSYLTLDDASSMRSYDESRIRVQWDISF